MAGTSKRSTGGYGGGASKKKSPRTKLSRVAGSQVPFMLGAAKKPPKSKKK